MSVERLVALAGFVVSAIVLARLGPGAVRSWRIYAETGERRQEDASGTAPPVPAGVADRTALLADLGYRLIGETRLALPVGMRFAWILAADDGESYAILAGGLSGRALTGIYSAWPDGTWLGTMHPFGAETDRPGLQVRSVPTTLTDAVTTHREGLERLRRVHGAPRPVRTMADMLALDADYRSRFGGSRLRPQVMRLVLLATAAAVAAVL
jgi:hypothetical protein